MEVVKLVFAVTDQPVKIHVRFVIQGAAHLLLPIEAARFRFQGFVPDILEDDPFGNDCPETWYNDSIASSPSRTIAGLDSFRQKIIIIAGGYDKKIPYEPLAPKIIEKVKALVLMGSTAPKIEAAVRACEGFAESGLVIEHAGDMEDAVAKARALAVPGDIVSLSPASASFDKYANFEERGRHFKSIVNGL